MVDTRREERTRRFLSLAAGRLAHNRWMLAAGWFAVLTVGFAVRAPLAVMTLAILFLLAVAALAPRRTRRERQADRVAAAEAGRLDDLSAQSLAAAVSDPLIIFDVAGT